MVRQSNLKKWESNSNSTSITIGEMLRELRKRPWKKGIYAKQSWGYSLHKMAPYVGRIKPAFAHWLIRICTQKEETILDPFCGIGTVLLEADLLGRKCIGFDLNPYAVTISKAKFDRRPITEHIDFINSIDFDEEVNLDNIPAFVKEYYHEKTLKEILILRDECLKHNNYFVLGCLLGIAHGHRDIHLSIRTGYIIPYIPKPKPKVVYKNVKKNILKKIKLMYKTTFPLTTKGEILYADARNMPLKDNSIDVVISSPPYYDTLDYIQSNFLRLALLNIDMENQRIIGKNLIKETNTYLLNMKKVGLELKRILKPDGKIIFVLGDVHKGEKSINTAADIEKVYSEIGFISHGYINDEIPTEKTTIVKFRGEEAIKKKKKKLDRILIMTVEKK